MSVLLSKKHGVNPSLMQCVVCGKDTGVALLGKIKGDAEAPRHIPDVEPCDDCKKELERHKKIGFVLLRVFDEAEGAKTSPWLYFQGYQVMKREAAERIFGDMDLSKGMAWVSDSVARQIGLPELKENNNE